MYTIQEHTNLTSSGEVYEEPTCVIDAVATDIRWSAIIGDATHNLYCCLDHLAHALAVLDSPAISGTDLSRVEFPIFKEERSLSNQPGDQRSSYREGQRPGIAKISPLSSAHKDIITQCQPYQRGPHGADAHPLWALYELRNIDTHEAIHTIAISVEFPKERLSSIRRIGERKIEIGFAKQKRKRFDLGIGESVRFETRAEGKFPAKVIFDEPLVTSFHGQDVLELLDAIRNEVAAIITRFEPSFR